MQIKLIAGLPTEIQSDSIRLVFSKKSDTCSEYKIYLAREKIGTIEMFDLSSALVVEMINIKESKRSMGIGTIILQTIIDLAKTKSKECVMEGQNGKT